MVIRASAGDIAGYDAIAEDIIGFAAGGVVAALLGDSAGTPAGALTPLRGAVSIGIVGGAIWPSGAKRKTISMPFLSPGFGSLAAACWRRKSIASRMLASRNSTRGIMIEFNFWVMRAVPVTSR